MIYAVTVEVSHLQFLSLPIFKEVYLKKKPKKKQLKQLELAQTPITATG